MKTIDVIYTVLLLLGVILLVLGLFRICDPRLGFIITGSSITIFGLAILLVRVVKTL